MMLICNGMPRAGSTLQYNLARLIIEEKELGQAHGFYTQEDCQSCTALFESWRRDSRLHLVKTHDCLPLGAETRERGRIKICYIYRNLYDVAASLKRTFKLENDELIRRLENALDVYEELSRDKGTLLQQYETVVDDLAGAARQISDLIGIFLENEEITQIVHRCSLSQMKSEIERKAWFGNHLAYLYRRHFGQKFQLKRRLSCAGVPERLLAWLKYRIYGINPDSLLHADHISISNGKNGNWREVLDENVIHLIGNRFQGWLEEAGYDVVSLGNT